MDFKYNNYCLEVSDHGGYQSRNSSMISLIREAWHSHVKDGLKPRPAKSFTLYTDDGFNPSAHFSFAVKDEPSSARSMPHFIFDKWTECGISDYMETFDSVLKAGDRPFESEKAFWIGTVLSPAGLMQGVRYKGLNLSEKRPDILDFRAIKWGKDPDSTPGYMTIEEQCSNRVLVDFGGFGFSARLPLLIASGRPVVVVGRPEEAWFYWDGSLRPWEHYVPCGDKHGHFVTEEVLEASIMWTFKNAAEAAEIGRRGREYALSNFTRDSVVRRIGLMMNGFCGDMFSGIRTSLISEGKCSLKT